jgi:spermidine synthase
VLNQEYGITYIPTYPCGSIGLLVCRKAGGAEEYKTCAQALREVPEDLRPHLTFYNTQLHASAFVKPTFVNQQLAEVMKTL